ncbi:MAG: hypothetical protein ACOC2K_00725 [Bacteroidota bacterium]
MSIYKNSAQYHQEFEIEGINRGRVAANATIDFCAGAGFAGSCIAAAPWTGGTSVHAAVVGTVKVAAAASATADWLGSLFDVW